VGVANVAAMAADTISFARGAPSADILPRQAVADAAAIALAEDWEKALSYGTGIGHPGLCQWIAERHGGLDASQVMVANGSLEAGWMLFEHLLEGGDRVVVEQPTYDRTLLMLQRLGVELVPVPLEDDGLDLAAFEAALAEGPIKLAHIIPNFHNPAGCTLSAEKRVRLVELAAEHGFWIFEDDPYRELPFEGEALETMLSLDSAERVVHASSFSKTVSPGVRVGYLAGPAAEIAELAKRANETYISPNMLAEAVVLELCKSGGLDRNIEFVKGALRERRDTLVETLGE
jgi:2-aminoadipate transaminase